MNNADPTPQRGNLDRDLAAQVALRDDRANSLTRIPLSETGPDERDWAPQTVQDAALSLRIDVAGKVFGVGHRQ